MTAAAASLSGASFNTMCRSWRQTRKLSQLELALAADVSQRHVSWLETGKSSPSREMVVRLCEAMDIPLRERNVLLQAAGFSAMYAESQLGDPSMEPVLGALRRVLDHHQPFPAVVIDKAWDVLMLNESAQALFSSGLFASSDEGKSDATSEPLNLAYMTLHPEGFRPFITNWEVAAPEFIRRLKNEAFASGDRKLQQRLMGIVEAAGEVEVAFSVSQPILPVLPLELNINGLELSLFSVISTFGTPQDITTDELRVEAFYPTDEKTKAYFESVI